MKRYYAKKLTLENKQSANMVCETRNEDNPQEFITESKTFDTGDMVSVLYNESYLDIGEVDNEKYTEKEKVATGKVLGFRQYKFATRDPISRMRELTENRLREGEYEVDFICLILDASKQFEQNIMEIPLEYIRDIQDSDYVYNFDDKPVLVPNPDNRIKVIAVDSKKGLWYNEEVMDIYWREHFKDEEIQAAYEIDLHLETPIPFDEEMRDQVSAYINSLVKEKMEG